MNSKIRYILLVVMSFVALVALSGCRQKYQVEEKVINGGALHATFLEVTISGRPCEIMVVLFSPNGKHIERTVKRLDMEMTGSTIVNLYLSELGSGCPGSFNNNTKSGTYKLVVQPKNGGTPYKKEIVFVGKWGNLSIERSEAQARL